MDQVGLTDFTFGCIEQRAYDLARVKKGTKKCCSFLFFETPHDGKLFRREKKT